MTVFFFFFFLKQALGYEGMKWNGIGKNVRRIVDYWYGLCLLRFWLFILLFRHSRSYRLDLKPSTIVTFTAKVVLMHSFFKGIIML